MNNNLKNSKVNKINHKQKTNVMKENGIDFLDSLSTHFLICSEKIPGKGEDCGFEAYTQQAGVIGVFDGCGGLGARVCQNAQDKTEAYLAARAVGSAVRTWFYLNHVTDENWNADLLKEIIVSKLKVCEENSGESQIKLKGSLIRPFPSTVALVTFRKVADGILSKHIWAGDSRTYVVDRYGLGQVSIDDIKGEDAMSNLSKDGALTNVVSADSNFVLHSKELMLKEPCIVMSATDGCFGYVSSPMEFEKMILESLIMSNSVSEWKKTLQADIANRAGDDQTISVAVFGFSSFEDTQKYYDERYKWVCACVNMFDNANTDQKQQLWQEYKKDYYRFIGE